MLSGDFFFLLLSLRIAFKSRMRPRLFLLGIRVEGKSPLGHVPWELWSRSSPSLQKPQGTLVIGQETEVS